MTNSRRCRRWLIVAFAFWGRRLDDAPRPRAMSAPPQVSELNAPHTLAALSTRDLPWCNEELQTRSSLSMHTAARGQHNNMNKRRRHSWVWVVCIVYTTLCYNLICRPSFEIPTAEKAHNCARAACGARFSVCADKSREQGLCTLVVDACALCWKMQMQKI